jgi:uncharacterized membrane protein
MEAFRRTIAYLVGLALVVGGIMDECPRVGAIAIGLLLMGVFSVPQALGIIRGKRED